MNQNRSDSTKFDGRLTHVHSNIEKKMLALYPDRAYCLQTFPDYRTIALNENSVDIFLSCLPGPILVIAARITTSAAECRSALRHPPTARQRGTISHASNVDL
jgi:hypothetical protein